MSGRLNVLVKDGNKKAAQVKAYVDRLRESNDELVARFDREDTDGGNPKPTSEIIIRENLLNNLTRQCVDVARRLQKSQQECQIALKQKRRRFIQVANPGMSKEDVDAAVNSGLSGNVIKQTMIEVRMFWMCICLFICLCFTLIFVCLAWLFALGQEFVGCGERCKALCRRPVSTGA